MEYKPNSGPHTILNSSGFLALQHAEIVWDDPRYMMYNKESETLRSYSDWPHGTYPSTEALSESGFSYSGILLLTVFTNVNITLEVF